MPHGSPPPIGDELADDETRFPDHGRLDSQTGVLLDKAVAAGASTPIPGIREDYGLTEVIVGADVAGEILVDSVPIRLPAGESRQFRFGEPVITGQPHTLTNNSAATMTVSLYAVGKQTRRPAHDNPPGDHPSTHRPGSRPAEALTH